MTGEFPNLIVIGANKAGTSSLHAYLAQHPDIFMCYPKEPMYFLMQNSDRHSKVDPRVEGDKKGAAFTEDEYKSLFVKAGSKKIRGESSTAYLANPVCAKRIKDTIPNVQLIAILREPIDRAFSNYKMYRQRGHEKMSFEDAIHEEMKTGRLNYPDGMRYLSLSCYSTAIAEYKKYFSEEQFRIFLYDEFRKDPEKMMVEIFDFIDVRNDFVPKMDEEHNVSIIQRYETNSLQFRFFHFWYRVFNKIKWKTWAQYFDDKKYVKLKMNPDTKAELKIYFRNEILKLQELTGNDLKQWLN